jgi:hypothetical protein
MKVCNKIKRLIDEAEQPDLFSFQVANHLSVCDGCKGFADERIALRQLLASSERVSAPSNFDAMLTARIARAKAGRDLSWLSLPSLMRLGAATAAIVMMVFVAQYANLFSNSNQVAQPEPSIAGASRASGVNPAQSPGVPDAQRDVNNLAGIEPERVRTHAIAAASVRLPQRYYARRGNPVAGNRIEPQEYSSFEEGGVVLVRGPNGEREVPMPTVSVGAQPLFYSRQTQPSRNVATSF